MTSRQRIAIRLAFILISIAGGLLVMALAHTTTEASCSSCTGTFYGAYDSLMNKAIGGNIWPQGTSRACAVADVVAVVNYDFLRKGYPLRFTNNGGQMTVEKNNQTTGASQWGYAKPTNAWGGITNIAPDFGNDPRSVAYDINHYDLHGSYIHNYIYRWQFAHTTEPSFTLQAQEATTLVVRELQNWKEPTVVFINGGLHSVLVTGAWSTNNPDANFPANVTGLVYRDSEGNATTSRQEISIGTWLRGGYVSPFGVYSLWSLYYGDRYAVGDMKNTYDPEPTVGIYTPTADNPHHWYRGFTWVEHDGDGNDNADWAINAYAIRIMRTP